MSSAKGDEASKRTRTPSTALRLKYVHGYLVVGMIDLAAYQFGLIDAGEAGNPQVRAMKRKLEKSRQRLRRGAKVR